MRAHSSHIARAKGHITRRLALVMLVLGTLLLGSVDSRAEEASSKEDGVRLKDLARIQGIRTNQLLGYGIVVGLPGTGDTRSTLASTSIQNLL